MKVAIKRFSLKAIGVQLANRMIALAAFYYLVLGFVEYRLAGYAGRLGQPLPAPAGFAQSSLQFPQFPSLEFRARS